MQDLLKRKFTQAHPDPFRVHPKKGWLIWSPPKIERDKDEKLAHVPSTSKPKSVTYATKPTPVPSATKFQDDKLDKLKTEVDSRFLTVQAEIRNVNSNMENWMKLLMDCHLS